MIVTYPIAEGFRTVPLELVYLPEVSVAKLSTSARKKLSTSSFAGPDRSYPVPDKSHAANAKARASQAVKAGRMSKTQEAKIDAKANRVLGKTKKGK